MARIRDLCPGLTLRRSSTRPGWRWYLRDEEAARAIRLFEEVGAGQAPPDVTETVIDRKPSKELSILASGARAVFCKEFHLDGGGTVRETMRLSGDRLGRKGAVTEAAGSLLAEGRFDRVPHFFALGERTRLGVVSDQVLLFEALLGHRTLLETLTSAPSDRALQSAVLGRALDLVVDLDAAGLAHLDANAKNIMISEPGPRDDRLVDLEQVVEAEPQRPDLLGFSFGYLYQLGVRDLVQRADYDDVAIPRLARALGVARPGELALRSYRYFQKKPLNRRERLRLARKGIAALPAVFEAVRHRKLGRLAGLLTDEA